MPILRGTKTFLKTSSSELLSCAVALKYIYWVAIWGVHNYTYMYHLTFQYYVPVQRCTMEYICSESCVCVFVVTFLGGAVLVYDE